MKYKILSCTEDACFFMKNLLSIIDILSNIFGPWDIMCDISGIEAFDYRWCFVMTIFCMSCAYPLSCSGPRPKFYWNASIAMLMLLTPRPCN